MGPATFAGHNVTPDSAMRTSAVYGCVKILSESIASMPLDLYRRLPSGGKERATDHPLYDLIHARPNETQSPYEWKELAMVHMGMRGNHWSLKETDSRGQIVNLMPLHPDCFQEARWDATSRRWLYRFTYPNIRTQGSVIYTQDQLVHIRNLSLDGILGLSPITQARQQIAVTMALEEEAGRFFANGARPGGVLKAPGRLTPEAHDRLKESWDSAHRGSARSHGTAILEEGLEYQSLRMTNEDSQFLESRKFQILDIARIYRIPPHMLGDLDRATFSNIEHSDLEFVKYTLMPWLNRIEQALARDLLTREERKVYFFEFNVDSLLRGDAASRNQSFAIARQNGWLSVNEIREMENRNPIPGGDEYLRPLNLAPIGTDPLDDPVTGNASLLRSVQESREQQEQQASGAPTDRASLPRHVTLRDDYLARFESTAQAILLDEIDGLRSILEEKPLDDQLTLRLDQFYAEREEHIRSQIEPLYLEYSSRVASAIAAEKGLAVPQLPRFAKEIASTAAVRWVRSSRRQIRDLAESTSRDRLFDDWERKRASEFADRESALVRGAVSRATFTRLGFSRLIWRASNSCGSLCRALDGRTIGVGEKFIRQGESIDGDDSVVSARTAIGHGPLHRGCDCFLDAE